MKYLLKSTIIYSYSKVKIVLTILLLSSVFSFAHGDLTQRIIDKTAEISKAPTNSELYFERGYLYQQHNEYDSAIKDYLKAEHLGVSGKLVFFRKAQSYYLNNQFNPALFEINKFTAIDAIDVKAKKLKAKIFYELKEFDKAVLLYDYVTKNMIDFRPEDIVEHTKFILAENNNNYKKAIDIVEFGLDKLGEDTLTLRLKKLELLKASNQTEETIKEYNYFIQKYNRKEFWYYKKAKYLLERNNVTEANINLQLAKVTIEQLNAKFQQVASVTQLKQQIKSLEEKINSPKS